MPFISRRDIRRWFHREDGSNKLLRDTDLKTQCVSSVRPAMGKNARPQSYRPTDTPRLSVPEPSIACKIENMNKISQGSVQNSSQQSVNPTTGKSHVHLDGDLWEKAKDALSDNDKAWIRETTGGASMSVHGMLDEMISLAVKGQRKWEASTTIQLDGHQFSLSDTASRTIVWLNKFKEIGDIIVQYDPVHAALPWAAARFILQAIVVSEEQQAASLQIIERVTRIVHRCRVYEELYNRNTVNNDAAENLESALIRLYVLVLQGLVATGKFLSKPNGSRTVHAILHPTMGSDILASLDRSENELGRDLTACESQCRYKADSRFQKQLRGLLELTEPVLRIDDNVKKTLQRLDKKELTDVLEWVSPITYRMHHDTVAKLRTKDTCNWLLERPKFDQWNSATSSITLWLQGYPGAGKTFLTSRIIEQVEATLLGRDNDEGFAFFYCNRNEEDRRNALPILRSYVRQLSRTLCKSDCIYPPLKQLCDKSRLEGSGWTFELCQESLVDLLCLYPRTILVLDALDECYPEERTKLLNFFDSIPKKSTKPVKVFISTRPEGDIRQRIDLFSSIEIKATDNENDIAKFVRQSIEENGRWRNALEKNESLKEEIVKSLLDKSDGMFQWANLQIKQLLNLRTEHEIRSRLGKLPKGLKAAYDEIYETVEALEPSSRAFSLRALRWIMCAFKPLTSERLLAAVHVDPDEETIDTETYVCEADVLDWCANFIRIDSQQNPPVWRFSHLSVVEYLETRWTVREAHCFVAKANLVFLLEVYGKTSKPNDIFQPHGSLEVYVQDFWIPHVQTQERHNADPKLANLLKAFLGSFEQSSVQYRAWHRRVHESCHRTGRSFPNVNLKNISPGTSTHFLASYFSLYTLLQDWWNALSDVSQIAESGCDLLTLAAIGGSKPICARLCEAGVDVNAPLPNKCYRSALTAAVFEEKTVIVQFLIDNGADVNMLLQTGYFGSALGCAIYKENIEIIKLLIDNGADVNMPLTTGRHASALEFAISKGNIEIIQLLIDNGTDLNMPLQTGYVGSALASAVSGENIEMVRLLIDNGADVNMPLKTGHYGSALECAVHAQSLEIIHLLIDKGADVNMPLPTGGYGSALAAAAFGGFIETVQLLVDNNANITDTLSNGRYRTALEAAQAPIPSMMDVDSFGWTYSFDSRDDQTMKQHKFEVECFLQSRIASSEQGVTNRSEARIAATCES
ncbi:hypothetical protein GGS21DRAFT_39862 [Xylaria nigripes]|nr:hypothetical protein GGS21DRAFT_39862 [Xylaria nigripes]